MKQPENPPYISVLPTFNDGFMATMFKWDYSTEEYGIVASRPRRPSRDAANRDAQEWAKLQGVELR